MNNGFQYNPNAFVSAAQEQRMMTASNVPSESINMVLTMTPALQRKIDAIALANNTDITDIMQRAIILLDVAAQVEANGSQLIIKSDTGEQPVVVFHKQ